MATEKELRAAINEIENVETLRAIFKDVADALRRKGVNQDSIHPEEYAGLIDGIDTVAAGTDDATAVASDIAKDKTAYVKGQKIVGNVLDVLDGSTFGVALDGVRTMTDDFLQAKGRVDVENILYRKGSYPSIPIPLSSFGDASASDVASGKTFTSSAGLKVNGTLAPGVDTSDATATESDIARGKTAYGKNGQITGNVETIMDGSISQVPFNDISQMGSNLQVTGRINYDTLFRDHSYPAIPVPLSNLGNAEASNVLSGKTFTSSAGLKVNGTYNPGFSMLDLLKTFDASPLNVISSTNSVANDIRNYLSQLYIKLPDSIVNESIIGAYVTVNRPKWKGHYIDESGNWVESPVAARDNGIAFPLLYNPFKVNGTTNIPELQYVFNNIKGMIWVLMSGSTIFNYTKYLNKDYMIAVEWRASSGTLQSGGDTNKVANALMISNKQIVSKTCRGSLQIKSPDIRTVQYSSERAVYPIQYWNFGDVVFIDDANHSYDFLDGPYLGIIW